MKILVLKLSNLASLAGEHVLDYRTGPLASAGLMAITGPTGAGKSTILDAICLALYGQVPRLRVAGKGLDGKVHEGAQELAMDDARTLLRRGTDGGYAILEFEGQDGRVYEASWLVRRKRGKSRELTVERSLTEVSSRQIIASRVTEFNEQIGRVVGLSFDQFTRAVMLAQSEFGAFLKATDEERAQLLEKLLATDIYRRLSVFAFEKRKQLESQYQEVQTQIGDWQPLASAERAQLDAQIAALALDKAQSEAKRRDLNAMQDWQKMRDRLQQQCDQSLLALQAARDAWSLLAPVRLEAQQLQEFQSIRPLIQPLATLQQRVISLSMQVATGEQAWESLQAQLADSERLQKDADLVYQDAKSLEQASRADLTEASRLEHEVRRLAEEQMQTDAHLQQVTTSLTEVQHTLDTHQQRRVTVQRERDVLGQQLQTTAELAVLDEGWPLYRSRIQDALQLLQSKKALDARITTRKSELVQMAQVVQQEQTASHDQESRHGTLAAQQVYIQTCRQQKDAVRLKDTALRDLIQQYQLYSHTRREMLGTQDKLDTMQKKYEALSVAQHAAQAQLQRADIEWTTLQKLLTRQRLLRSASVAELRQQLISEQPCPVCGSTDHPFAVSTHMVEVLARQDEVQEDEARQKLTTLQDEERRYQIELQHLAEIRQELQLGLEHLQIQEKVQKQALLGLPLASELRVVPDEERMRWLTQQLSHNQQEEQRLSTVLEQLEQVERSTRMQLEQLFQHQHSYQQLQQGQESLVEQHARIQAQQVEIEQAFTATLPVAWLTQWHSNPQDMFERLAARMLERLTIMHQHQALEAELQDLTQQNALLVVQRTQYAGQIQNLKQTHARVTSEWQQSHARLHGFLMQASQTLGQEITQVSQWQTQLSIHVQSTEHAVRRVHELHQQLLERMQTVKATLVAHQQQKTESEHDLTVIVQRIRVWRETHAIVDELFQRLQDIDEQQEAEIRKQLSIAQDAFQQAESQWAVYCKQREVHQTQMPGLSAVSGWQDECLSADDNLMPYVQEVELQLQMTQEAWVALRVQLQQDDERRNRTTALQAELEQRRAAYLRFCRMADLIASSDGKKFQKIAQGFFLDRLLEDANQQLELLSRRYQLKRAGDSLSLLVIDQDMGDEVRSVHSLSGGESFLVSLALALGLAAMASGRLRIESLFIDEGFGTLDPESLQTVMDALDRLQDQGRKVTVITHVQELHERIPTQIQVRKLGHGQSKLTVV